MRGACLQRSRTQKKTENSRNGVYFGDALSIICGMVGWRQPHTDNASLAAADHLHCEFDLLYRDSQMVRKSA
jgi:hypothetical protein